MSEDEVYEMQCKIDEGIYLAQKRLVERAKHNHTTLIIAREGQVVEELSSPNQMTKPIYPENRLPDEWQIENADPKMILRSALYI